MPKKGRDICTFNVPLFPMPSTMILQPLDLCHLKDKETEHLKANLKKFVEQHEIRKSSEFNFT